MGICASHNKRRPSDLLTGLEYVPETCEYMPPDRVYNRFLDDPIDMCGEYRDSYRFYISAPILAAFMGNIEPWTSPGELAWNARLFLRLCGRLIDINPQAVVSNTILHLQHCSHDKLEGAAESFYSHCIPCIDIDNGVNNPSIITSTLTAVLEMPLPKLQATLQSNADFQTRATIVLMGVLLANTSKKSIVTLRRVSPLFCRLTHVMFGTMWSTVISVYWQCIYDNRRDLDESRLEKIVEMIPNTPPETLDGRWLTFMGRFRP